MCVLKVIRDLRGHYRCGCVTVSDTSPSAESPRRRSGLLRDQVQLVKRKDTNRYEIVPIQDPLSFEKGFFIVIRACQLLSQKNEGIIFVGVAGPSGAGKTVFTEKVLNFMPSIVVITMDNYNDASRIVDGNFDGEWKVGLQQAFCREAAYSSSCFSACNKGT
ncbi:hypothetical protein RJ639_031529 [Escallonia herrerae]|uniref:Phosphoribulokinase/uridine kinase domain-containing protein n=1 Tax=Escallonia herrerae TaxID=1293975 RepID=A0AA89BCT4_9ASTE|nr:hypothetical protein RJ639_031529 [Escallonia herrerae]